MKKGANYSPNCNCHECGRPMYRPPAHLLAGKLPFCSRECWRAWNKRQDNSYLRTKKSRYNYRLAIARKRVERDPSEKGKYIAVPCPPKYKSMAMQNGMVLEHRLVMAIAIGRPLEDHEVVHHINGDTHDNRLENLRLYSSQRDHFVRHHLNDRIAENIARAIRRKSKGEGRTPKSNDHP